MKLELPNGRKAELKVYYEVEKKKRRGRNYRSATIHLTVDGNVHIGKAVCSPFDNFNRLIGRKIALTKLFEPDQDKKIFSKEDRTFIFKTVCSKFFKNS